MAFATNTNYMAPVLAPDLGTPTKVVPTDLANGFVPETPITAAEMNYCLGRLCPRVETFTANGTWTKRAGDLIVEILCIGGGGGGATGGVGIGGDGGHGAERVSAVFPASMLPATLAVERGGGGNANQAGGYSRVADGSNSLLVALGGTSGTGAASGSPSDALWSESLTVPGGAAVAASAGQRGHHSRYGTGGAGGATNAGGVSGRGYGAGGGGGRQNSSSIAGGGGGGGGYGPEALAGATPANSTGAVGAPGVVVFIVWGDIT